MRKAFRTVGAALLLALTAGLLPASGPARPSPAPEPLRPPLLAAVPPAVSEAIREAEERGRDYLDVELQAPDPAAVTELKEAVAEAGGEVITEEQTLVQARLPVAAAESLLESAPVVAMETNRQLRLDRVRTATLDEVLPPAEASPLIGVNLEPIGVPAFRAQSGSQGEGIVVAVIDSGIDPGHPALQQTPSGRRKIIDWRDFTREGEVTTPHPVSWGETYTAPDGRRYRLPPRPAASAGARFGYWVEFNVRGTYLGRDLNRNGLITDRFGVLVVDSQVRGRYDTVYVDTNDNGSFADEMPLRLFRESGAVGHLGRSRQPSRQLNFVLADIDPAGEQVTFGFDGVGHGTQVAGVLGAYSPGGFAGVAPGVQLMALKVLASNEQGDWFSVKKAIAYAAEQGADIINISVGGLGAAAQRYDSTASQWLNQIAREHDVLIVIAADNSGPGLSSGVSLGSPSEVMTVGAYYSPEMWKRDFGYVVPSESVWFQSGMGPRLDGSYVPSVVAPGGSPTTSPLWRHETGYTTEMGTSIATPHVSGAAALLMEAGRRAGVNHDRSSIRRALEMGARRIRGFEVYEQGHGLISLPAAYRHLRRIDSVPQLQARSHEGNLGLLARSYSPGSASFWLTNLGAEVTRVSLYTLADWIRLSASSLTLPPGTAREVTFQLEPPESTGVHSAMVEVVHPDKYGTSLSIPVTYVRPVDLGEVPEHRFAETRHLEVAHYQRYFFAVRPGSSRLHVMARVLQGQERAAGTIQVHVFRPDGQLVHKAKIGADGRGLTTLLETVDPVSGVWEVVITAMPDSKGAFREAGYTLEVEARPGALGEVPLRINVPAGAETTHEITVTNPFGNFTGRVEAVGLTPMTSDWEWSAGHGWRVEKPFLNVVEDFTLREFTMRMRVEIDNPVPSDVDLNLSLFYLDPRRGWVLRGQSQTSDSSREAVEVKLLPAGRYQVIVTRGSDSPWSQYQYRRLMGVDTFRLDALDEVRQHRLGETWTVPLHIKAPREPGRYLGHILIRDTEADRTLGWYPVEVSVGEPELSVQPMVSQLTRGKPSFVVLEVRDAATGRLTDATLTVGGRRYVSRGGRVTIPLTPEGESQVLLIEADVPGYRFVRQEVRLPVRERWGLHPTGIDFGEELPDWRRKVMSQLREP